MNRRELLQLGLGASLLSGPCAASWAQDPDPSSLQRLTHRHPTMGTAFRFIVYANDPSQAGRAFDEAGKRLDALNLALSDYDSESELSRLSSASGNGSWRLIREDLWRVLQWGQVLSAQSDGAFDMTVGPLSRLWRVSRRNGKLPTPRRLTEALEATGFQHLVLDGTRQRARLMRTRMRLDLGGIAKGFAVDEALACLQSHGIRIALVDGGGDLRVIGKPPGTQGWSIAFEDLQASGPQEEEPKEAVPLSDLAVATSGDLYQSVQIGDREFSHIIDPQTGLGLEFRRSVTVAAPTALMADALASALSVMPPVKSKAMLREHYPAANARILTRTPNGLDVHVIGKGPIAAP